MKLRPLACLKWLLLASWCAYSLGYFFLRFPLINLVDVILHGMLLMLLVGWFVVAGNRILRGFRLNNTSFSEELCLSFGFGTASAMLVVFLMAAMQALYEPLIVGLVVGVGVGLYRDAKALCLRGHHEMMGALRQPHAKEEVIFFGLSGLAGAFTLFAAATPTFFFDALYYHLAVPHKYLLFHGFHAIPAQDFSNLPANLGLLFLVAMSFSKTLLPQLLSWAFMPITAFMVFALAKRYWGTRLALLSAMIFLLIPAISISSTLTAPEGGLVFYSMLSLYAFLRYAESLQRKWFVMAALFCSLACGTKYTAFATAFVGMTAIVAAHELFERRRGMGAAVRTLLLFAALVTLGVSPWFIKNIVYTGNPMYPFLQSFFGQHANQTMQMQHILKQSSDANPLFIGIFELLRGSTDTISSLQNLLFLVLTIPWTFTMKIVGAAGKPGILFLICLPGIAMIPKLDRPIKYLLGFAGCSFGCWMFLLPWLQRYAFPIFAPLSIAVGYIVFAMPTSARVKRFLLGGVALISGYHLLLFVEEEMRILRAFDYLLGNQTQYEYLLNHDVAYYPAIQYVNAMTPPSSKILFVAEPRGFYCERDYLLYTPLYAVEPEQMPLRKFIGQSADSEELQQRLRQAGITHILINHRDIRRAGEDAYFGLTTPREREMLHAVFSSRFSRRLFSQYGVEIYELLFQPK